MDWGIIFSMENIAIIGTGYVGLVSGACLADFGHTVICIDIDKDKIDGLKQGSIPIYEPGIDLVVERNVKAGRLAFSNSINDLLNGITVVFIAVGTPPSDDGSADLTYVENAAREIGSLITEYTVIVNKSTVPVGTGRKVIAWVAEELQKRNSAVPFDVVSNPEFLREGSAVYDFTHPDRIVIGSDSEKARSIMKAVYRSLYINDTPYIETSLESAEMIKYASNAFLAVKVTFINEIANLCAKTGADVQDVAKAMGRDERIGSKYLNPGPGFGGSCFPKDTRALAKIGREHDEIQSIVESTIAANERQKILAAQKIEAAFGGILDGKLLAILGLSFKPNTDDMRESPAIAICEYLATRGALLRLYDPAAMDEAEWRLASIKDSLYYAIDEYDAIHNAHALILVTEWNQFRNINLLRAKELLATPYFFDLRNIYAPEAVAAAGLQYFGIGRQ